MERTERSLDEKGLPIRLLGASKGIRYAIAVLAVTGGALLRVGLGSFWSPFELPFITFYPAVMVSAWLGGLGAGLLATFLSTAIAAKFWMPTVLAGPDLAALLIFVLTGTFISVLNEAWRREQVSVLRSQQHLRTTLSSIGDAVIATDAAGRITRLNPVAEELTGWRAADATGHAIEDVFVIFNEDSGEPAENPIRRVLKEGVIQDLSNHTVLVSKDGRRIPVDDRAAPIREVNDKVTGVVMVFRDVTERRRVELERAALLEREQEARRQAEQALIQLHGIQAVTDIALANLDLTVLMRELLTRVRDILGADTASLLFLEPDGKHLIPAASDGLREEIGDKVRIPLGRGAAGQIAQSEHGLVFNDIADIEVISPFLRNYVKSLAGVPLRVSGELVGVLHVGSVVHRRFGSDDLHLLSLVAERIALAIERARLHDAERRSKAEAERANRLKDEFLAVLSHELRTPLTSILGWAHVLKSREIRPERTGHAVQAIERGAQAAANLVNSLLDLSRIISGQLHLEMRPLDLVSTITAAVDTIRPVAEAKSLTVEVIVPPTPIILTGDANRLEQVVLNLLSNAVKFTPDHGRIQVRLRQVESSAEIEVNDTGRGIRPEFLPHVFDRFVQAESSESRVGIGLGLAIVRELVQGHGGNIHAASAGEGQGSTFTVRLPLMPVTARLPL